MKGQSPGSVSAVSLLIYQLPSYRNRLQRLIMSIASFFFFFLQSRLICENSLFATVLASSSNVRPISFKMSKKNKFTVRSLATRGCSLATIAHQREEDSQVRLTSNHPNRITGTLQKTSNLQTRQ